MAGKIESSSSRRFTASGRREYKAGISKHAELLAVCEKLFLYHAIKMHERTAILIVGILLDGEFNERQVRYRLATIFPSAKRSVWARQLFDFAKSVATDHSGKLISAKLIRALIEAVAIAGMTAKVIRRLDEIARHVQPSDRPVARMLPTSVCAAEWSVPPVTTFGQLADFLSVPHQQLEWFADLSGRQASESNERLRHYRYRWIRKQSAGYRLLETPKPKLKEIQRVILSKILNHIPAHPAAHGFVRGKSCQTAAGLHVGKKVVLRIDLRHFFPSVHAGRVIATFRSAGYPQRIAQLLAGLCTNTTLTSAVEQQQLSPTVSHRFHDPASRHFLLPHLPQGSPTSPALANLAASKLDARLSGLASAFDATYTRYADDLVFSGNEEFSRDIDRAKLWICAICLNEGFHIQQRKTTIQRQHQQQRVHGIVVNFRPAVSRKQRDELKAILHNCVRLGVIASNRENRPNFRAHLQGRISMVAAICPQQADKLRAVFKQITWDALG